MNTSYKDRILNKIKSYREIRKIAKDNNVDFFTAFLYFENKDTLTLNDAREIIQESVQELDNLIKKSKELNISFFLLNSIIEEKRLEIEDDGLHHILIAEDITIEDLHKSLNNKYGTDLTKKIGEPNNYLFSITTMNRKYGLPLSLSKKIVDFKIKRFAKKNNVSFDMATLMVNYDYSKETAENVMTLIDYYGSINHYYKQNLCDITRKYLEESPDVLKKEIHGFLITSKSQEGLDNLEKIINNALTKGKKDYVEKFLSEASSRRLMVTDFYPDKTSQCNPSTELIYLENFNGISNTLEEMTTLFFHESTHFIDLGNNFSTKNYSVVYNYNSLYDYFNDKMLDKTMSSKVIPDPLKEDLREFFIKHSLPLKIKGAKIALSNKDKMSDEYVHNDDLQKKWKDEIDKEFSDISEKDKERLFKQKVAYEKNKYIGLIDFISDIYDALAAGELLEPKISKLRIPGHGKNYYGPPHNRLIEFIANIGSIYNADGEDVLSYEFGPELTQSFVDMYKEMLSYSKDSNKDAQFLQFSISDYNNRITPYEENPIIWYLELHEMLNSDIVDKDLVEEITPGDDMIELRHDKELQIMIDGTPIQDVGNNKTM